MKITSPDAPELVTLCEQLAALADQTDRLASFPYEQIRLCGEAGVFEWFLAPEWGGQAWADADVVRGYLKLSQACLTTTFVITQRTGACRRIVSSRDDALKQRLLPPLARGETFSTVGISHLTTSGRHLAAPLLAAEPSGEGFTLTGKAPWVTGAEAADNLVLGVSITKEGHPTDEEALVVVPTDAAGVTIGEPFPLVGVTASSTGPVLLDGVTIDSSLVIAGPTPAVMASGTGGRTGGFETSTLALGVGRAALAALSEEAARREDLADAYARLAAEAAEIETDLLATAQGQPVCTNESLRTRANSFVLRSTQAALAAAKGRGYLASSPVGRWCREALFFLVWSCPAPVANANLCELAGIGE